jgi:hypothetical protein
VDRQIPLGISHTIISLAGRKTTLAEKRGRACVIRLSSVEYFQDYYCYRWRRRWTLLGWSHRRISLKIQGLVLGNIGSMGAMLGKRRDEDNILTNSAFSLEPGGHSRPCFTRGEKSVVVVDS